MRQRRRKKRAAREDTTSPDHSPLSRGRPHSPPAGSFVPELSSSRRICLFPAICACLLALGCCLLAPLDAALPAPVGSALKYRDSASSASSAQLCRPLHAVRCTPSAARPPSASLRARPVKRIRTAQGQPQMLQPHAQQQQRPVHSDDTGRTTHASYMYGRHPHPLLPCRSESCTSHPCLGPTVGSLLGRDVSRAPAASPGACAQHVRLWQYGHARHERNRGTFLLYIPLTARPSPAPAQLPHSSLLLFVIALQ